jgi:hypothetical protein
MLDESDLVEFGGFNVGTGSLHGVLPKCVSEFSHARGVACGSHHPAGISPPTWLRFR